MGYYLLIKTIDQNGFRYLCKCMDNKDHIKYKGSGVLWRKVLKAHPTYTVSTTVLGHYDTKEELKSAGLYYSELFDVVKDKSWANCIPESGDGGSTTNGKIYARNIETRQERLFEKEEDLPEGWVRGRFGWTGRTPEHSAALLAAHQGATRSEDTRKNMRNSVRRPRRTISCKLCEKQFTLQNIKRHEKICKE